MTEHLRAQWRTAALDLHFTERRSSGDYIRTLDVHLGGEHVGRLEVEGGAYSTSAGELREIEVKEGYRRQGIATALWQEAARRWSDISLRHSELRTRDGDAWAKEVGDDLPPLRLSDGPMPSRLAGTWRTTAGDVWRKVEITMDLSEVLDLMGAPMVLGAAIMDELTRERVVERWNNRTYKGLGKHWSEDEQIARTFDRTEAYVQGEPRYVWDEEEGDWSDDIDPHYTTLGMTVRFPVLIHGYVKAEAIRTDPGVWDEYNMVTVNQSYDLPVFEREVPVAQGAEVFVKAIEAFLPRSESLQRDLTETVTKGRRSDFYPYTGASGQWIRFPVDQSFAARLASVPGLTIRVGGDGEKYVALLDGEEVGELVTSFADGEDVDTGLEIIVAESLWVHPDHRRKGIANALYDRLLRDYPSDAYVIAHTHRTQDGAAWARARGLEDTGVSMRWADPGRAARRTASRITKEQQATLLSIHARYSSEIQRGVCGKVAEVIEAELGWRKVMGLHRGRTMHAWNVLADGTIIDATHDQFGPGEWLRVEPGGHPDYRPFTEADLAFIDLYRRARHTEPEAYEMGYARDEDFLAELRAEAEAEEAEWDRMMRGGRRTALPTSWRPFSQDTFLAQHDCVIVTQFSGRNRRYEVYTYGIAFGDYLRLDEAKQAIEVIYGPLPWRQVRMPKVEVEHYYFGPTTEFTDPLTIHVVDSLPRLGSRTASAGRFFHVTRTERRESIRARGLDYRDQALTLRPAWANLPDGNYLFQSEDHARWFAARSQVPVDLWSVDITGLTLYPDVGGRDYQSAVDSYYTTEPIDPRRLRLEGTYDRDMEAWASRGTLGSTTASMGVTYYHISPRRNRESITQGGLRLSDIDGRHIWLFSDLATAQESATKLWGGSRDNDIWVVDVGEAEVAPDPHAGWGDARDDVAHVVMQAIPPHRVRLLR
jgi:ribosomal protein S18 acetylase RimI-like enzyme